MPIALKSHSRIGLLSPALDAHRLGVQRAARLIRSCGLYVSLAPMEVRSAAEHPDSAEAFDPVIRWIREEALDALAFSYRLDPKRGADLFDILHHRLSGRGLLAERGGPIAALFFAGLPEACARVAAEHPSVGVFSGAEPPRETLFRLGLPSGLVPADIGAVHPYDEWRASFGEDLVARGDYRALRPADRSGSSLFGLRGDTLAARLAYGRSRNLPPLIRSHAGPFSPDRREALALFDSWTRELAGGGLLDILSIGTSQLSQECFGGDWTGKADGGGVPIRTREELEAVWRAARPMLVRTYAGTKDVPALAALHQESIDIAWHAFSFWWFSLLDGRGPNPVLRNLEEVFAALRVAAAGRRPVEPNTAHHFSFRGADDLTGIVATYIAARAARRCGVDRLVLQTMLNTPKETWGIQDLAKARALLALVRGIPGLEVHLQPRGGLDHFSPDETVARAQLAASAALMDDIEPSDPDSPGIIHVVGYSEARGLADPAVIQESIRITLHALSEYRRLRRKGSAPDLRNDRDTEERTASLVADARTLIGAFESAVEDPYSPKGLYSALSAGLLAAPELSACREEFPGALEGVVDQIEGASVLTDGDGRPIGAEERARRFKERLEEQENQGGPHA